MATNSLEQQALDRVARMYAGYDRRQAQSRNPAPEPVQEQPPEPSAQEQPKAVEPEKKPSGLLDALMEDKEQSLILLLLVILMKDGADLNIVLALMYIIL